MTQKILLFEEFIERTGPHPRYDNFIYLFYPNTIASESARKKDFFIEFKRYFPGLEAKLSQEIPLIRKNNPTFEGLEPLEPYLYVAYCIMRSYGADDESLIGTPGAVE